MRRRRWPFFRPVIVQVCGVLQVSAGLPLPVRL
jgi:hypothetical protein